MGEGARPVPAPPLPSPRAELITALYSETRAARIPAREPTVARRYGYGQNPVGWTEFTFSVYRERN